MKKTYSIVDLFLKSKIWFILAIIVLVIGVLCSCGKEQVLVERSIDGVAEYLGYFDGEDIDLYEEGEISEALAGKYFKDGGVSIYEFNPNSPTYKFWESETDTCIDGFLLLYDNLDSPTPESCYEMDKEIDKIKSIQFKPEED